jgi:hypothetical protein
MRKALPVCLVLMITSAFAQQNLFKPAADTVPESRAVRALQKAFELECEEFQSSNPNVACGSDVLLANHGLRSWGFTSANLRPEAKTITRYNPETVEEVFGQFGVVGAFFVFAHEAGHHFDFQFRGLNIPWDLSSLPAPPIGVPQDILDSWDDELRADVWAGCALKKNGMSVLPAIRVNEMLDNWGGGEPDIPPLFMVVAAIDLGYKTCN